MKYILGIVLLLLIPFATFAIFNESRDRGRENPKFKTYSNSKELNLKYTKNLKKTLFSVYKTLTSIILIFHTLINT